jgi:hypothetical protein
MYRPRAGASRLLCGFWTGAHAFLKRPYGHLTTCASAAERAISAADQIQTYTRGLRVHVADGSVHVGDAFSS